MAGREKSLPVLLKIFMGKRKKPGATYVVPGSPFRNTMTVFAMSFCQILDYFAYLINGSIKLFRDLVCGIMQLVVINHCHSF